MAGLLCGGREEIKKSSNFSASMGLKNNGEGRSGNGGIDGQNFLASVSPYFFKQPVYPLKFPFINAVRIHEKKHLFGHNIICDFNT